MLKEVEFSKVTQDLDPMTLFRNGAIAIASDGKETNGLTIGWGSLGTLWSKPCCSVYVHALRYSKHIFDGADGFSVCWLSEEHKNVVNYFGTASGRDEDKMANSKLTVASIDGVPYFEESDMVIICKKMGQSDFDANNISVERINNWYKKDGVHTIYQGEITHVLRKG